MCVAARYATFAGMTGRGFIEPSAVTQLNPQPGRRGRIKHTHVFLAAQQTRSREQTFRLQHLNHPMHAHFGRFLVGFHMQIRV